MQFESQKVLLPIRASPAGICYGHRRYTSRVVRIHCIASRSAFLDYTVCFCCHAYLHARLPSSVLGYGVSTFRWKFYPHSCAMTFSVALVVTTSDSCCIYVVCSDATESDLCVHWAGKVVSWHYVKPAAKNMFSGS